MNAIENKINAITENFEIEMSAANTAEKQATIFRFYRDGFKGWGFTANQAAGMVRSMLISIAEPGTFSDDYCRKAAAQIVS